ncbi:MAG: hypothetical protein KGH72_01695 [Candidatus Micrarchaeota archaeon]|nr:hypothetical protein [Candidatus Micrarchaeota archaeon]
MALEACGYSIALDTHDSKADVNFVSHAHSDHTSGLRKSKKVIASAATMDLIEVRKRSRFDALEIPQGIRMLNSGHMLGSKQLYVENGETGISFLYSGDFQMQESQVADRIETTEADVLVIDSTYPYPDVQFDDRSETITAIQHYATAKLDYGVTLFGAYTMGKAQEMIRILNEAGIAPFVSWKIAEICEAYGRHNVRLDYLPYKDDNELSALAKRVSVGVVDVGRVEEVRRTVSENANRRVFTAVATGFAKMFKFNTDVQFTLSDHADFAQSVEYIGLCNPKVIYTCGGNSQVFAKNLSAKGYNAHPVWDMSEICNVASLLTSKIR